MFTSATPVVDYYLAVASSDREPILTRKRVLHLTRRRCVRWPIERRFTDQLAREVGSRLLQTAPRAIAGPKPYIVGRPAYAAADDSIAILSGQNERFVLGRHVEGFTGTIRPVLRFNGHLASFLERGIADAIHQKE